MATKSNDSSGISLTRMTYVGRQSVKLIAIGLVVMIVGRMAISAFITYWKATHPPPPPPPTVGFGILPRLRFPVQTESDLPQSYQLETATGTTPSFGDRAKVFLMPKSVPSLLADDTAKNIAAELDYVFQPELLNSSTYRWTKSDPVLSTLELDIINHHFSLTTDYLSRPELIIAPNLPSGFQAVSLIKDYIDSANLLPSDMATVSGEIVYLKSLGGELTEAVSESDADFIQVDINRSPVDNEFRMYSPEGYTGVISGIVAGGDTKQGQIVKLHYYYNPIDYSQVHTYPIRSSTQAWQLLQAGEGYIVDPGQNDTAIVRQVTLGYYDDFEEQAYLQPIYVFEGDNGFMGYVPAVSSDFIQ